MRTYTPISALEMGISRGYTYAYVTYIICLCMKLYMLMCARYMYNLYANVRTIYV